MQSTGSVRQDGAGIAGGARRRGRLAASLLGLVVAVTAAGAPAQHGARRGVPPIEHVFIIVLENESYRDVFGPGSPAPYLSKTLPAQGVLLSQYFGTTHASLGNYLAMISGQAGTPETRDDCEVYADFVQTGTTPDGQAIGHGCVYPATVHTLADQLEARGRRWRAYLEDMGNDPRREAPACAHPVLGAADPTQEAEAPSAAVPRGDQYATRHNPFMYFHSIIDAPTCAERVVNLDHLAHDLESARRTPHLAFIVPNLCHDGHDAPCKSGEPGGLVSADRFLQEWVPRILASPAYRQHGMLLITFDEGADSVEAGPAGSTVATAPGQTCCSQQPGPNLGPFPQTLVEGNYRVTYHDFGGDRTGAVLLSPFVRPGTVSYTPFNHYSLLKTLEDIYQTDGYLGYAGQPGLVGFFGFTASDIAPRRAPRR